MNDLLADRGAEFLVERFTKPTLVDLVWQNDSYWFTIEAVAQDKSGRFIVNLTDAQRQRGVKQFMTIVPLYAAQKALKKGKELIVQSGSIVLSEGEPVYISASVNEKTKPRSADIVHIDGERWEVFNVTRGVVLEHWSSLARLVEE